MRGWLFSSIVALGLSGAASARADGGAWLWFEYRHRLLGGTPSVPRLVGRVVSDTRFSADAKGLAQQFLRIGPMLDVTSWFTLAINGTIYADRRPGERFEQEARLELEPNFQWRWGRFALTNRHRLEYRWREAAARVRYRHRLWINYQPIGARFIPFVWDEVLFDFREGFNENRLVAGLGVMLTPMMRLDLAYVLRSRDLPTGWQHDHLGLVYLLITPR